MATETQRHRDSKTLSVSAGRGEISQGAHDAAAGCAWTKFESVNKILVSERIQANQIMKGT